MAISAITKKGNKEGNILSLQILIENITDFKIDCELVNISQIKKHKIIKALIDINFCFINHLIIFKGGLKMINKLYESIKNIFKKNYLFFLGFLIALLLMTIKLPYYVNYPGGFTDVNNKVSIAQYQIPPNTYNMAYVTELQATIPIYFYVQFNKSWDLKKIEAEENKKDLKYHSQMQLKEATQKAILVAYRCANKEINIKDKSFYITYVAKEALTNLKAGDKIMKVNDIIINDLEQLNNILNQFKEKETVTFEIERNNKIVKKSATLQMIENRNIIGIIISPIYDFDTNPPVDYKYDKVDSGPSGGFITSLALYDTLTGSKLHKGRKIVGTGTIDENGKVGEVGGIEYKIKGAVKKDVDLFFVPSGSNYEEAIKIKKENNYDLLIVPIKTINEAINYLKLD